MTREEVLEEIIKSSFHLNINMNDTFYYASADSSELAAEDALDLVELIQQYGINDVLIAYEAIKRDEDPNIPQNISPIYFEVKNKLLDKMSSDSNFLPVLNYEKRIRDEEIKVYGGKLQYKFVPPTIWRKISGQTHYTCECWVHGKSEKGYGSNMMTASKDLAAKLGIKI